MKLHVLSFGLSVGIVWGLCILILTWLSILEWEFAFKETVKSFHLSYMASFWEILFGTFWNVVTGFTFGVLIAFFYNLFSKKK